MGYSGAGKSTLARKLGRLYGAEVLHLDTVHWLPGWNERSDEEKQTVVSAFMQTHDSWVIDGNYSRLFMTERLEQADMIVELLFGPFSCFFRAFRRYRKYRGSSRPDMTEGCPEKLDAEFIRWIFFGGRKKAAVERYRRIREKYREKTVVIRNQLALNKFLANTEKQTDTDKTGKC